MVLKRQPHIFSLFVDKTAVSSQRLSATIFACQKSTERERALAPLTAGRTPFIIKSPVPSRHRLISPKSSLREGRLACLPFVLLKGGEAPYYLMMGTNKQKNFENFIKSLYLRAFCLKKLFW